MVDVEIPGRGRLILRHAVFDFNGTLARDGEPLDDVVQGLARVQAVLSCVILSADTHGTLARLAGSLGVPVQVVRDGDEKAAFIARLEGPAAAVGNGRNDVPMFRAAALSIAVLGPEGLAVSALLAADIVVAGIGDAFALLTQPARLVSTLRH
jgi:soluble P-type ATPase